MKIIRSFFSSGHRYRVLKSFQFSERKGARPRATIPGEWLTFHDKTEVETILDLVAVRKIVPELPEKAVYRVRRSFSLRLGNGKVEEVVRDELVEMIADDAVLHLVRGYIIPVQAEVWAPYQLQRSSMMKHLGTPINVRPLGNPAGKVDPYLESNRKVYRK